MASNLSISHLRKISSHLRWLDSVNTIESEQESIIDSVSVKDLQKIIYEAVEALPPKRKEIFQLSRNDGMSIDQIAAHLNLSRSTVKNQISIALKYVQSHIEREASICLPLFFIYFLFF